MWFFFHRSVWMLIGIDDNYLIEIWYLLSKILTPCVYNTYLLFFFYFCFSSFKLLQYIAQYFYLACLFRCFYVCVFFVYFVSATLFFFQFNLIQFFSPYTFMLGMLTISHIFTITNNTHNILKSTLAFFSLQFNDKIVFIVLFASDKIKLIKQRE